MISLNTFAYMCGAFALLSLAGGVVVAALLRLARYCRRLMTNRRSRLDRDGATSQEKQQLEALQKYVDEQIKYLDDEMNDFMGSLK